MKAYKVVFTRAADTDFDEIIDYIAQDNPTRAITFVDELRDVAINTRSVFPKAGSSIRELGAYFHVHKNYVIVYDIDEDEHCVIVHMISHGARQWRSVFAARL